MLTLIAARDRNGAIGKNNTIPWHAPEDLAFFQRETTGGAVIMGRRTWESLPFKPLKNRLNLVVSSDPAVADHVFPSPEGAVDHAHAARLRHGDRHARFGDGVHCGRHDRDVERDRAGDSRADIDFRGKDVGQTGLQKHIVEREGFSDSRKSRGHCQLLICGRGRNGLTDERRLRRRLLRHRRIGAHRWG